jgi:ATP-dependent RNA helicase DeaD
LTNTPKEKKVLLFSATMPRTILKIAETYMKNYDFVEIKSDTKISPKISQEYYEVAPRNKFNILQRIIDFKEDFY